MGIANFELSDRQKVCNLLMSYKHSRATMPIWNYPRREFQIKVRVKEVKL